MNNQSIFLIIYQEILSFHTGVSEQLLTGML